METLTGRTDWTIYQSTESSWHGDIFSIINHLCGKPLTDGFPVLGSVIRSLRFFYVSLNKLMNIQSICRWTGSSWHPWHINVTKNQRVLMDCGVNSHISPDRFLHSLSSADDIYWQSQAQITACTHAVLPAILLQDNVSIRNDSIQIPKSLIDAFFLMYCKKCLIPNATLNLIWLAIYLHKRGKHDKC